MKRIAFDIFPISECQTQLTCNVLSFHSRQSNRIGIKFPPENWIDSKQMSQSSEHRPALLGGRPIRGAAPLPWPLLNDAIAGAFRNLIQSGDWGRYHGPNVPELVRALSTYHKVAFVHPCSSGTAAVELALRGMSVGAGDEVILAAYDFKANFQNVLTVGATPVLVDIRHDNGQIDPSQLASAVSERTKAIIVSHLHGGIVDMPAVMEVARARNLLVLEDACQNPGASYHGRKAGTAGDVSVLSFGGSKLLTAGRGGAVMTNREDLFERIRRYVLRGNDAYPISEMQAAGLIPQLNLLDELNDRRRLAVAAFDSALKAFPGLTILQPPTESIFPAYYKVGLRYRASSFDGLSRNRFSAALRAEGIPIHAGFRSLHLIHAKRRFQSNGDLTEATLSDEEFLTLHHPVLLEGRSAVKQIVAALGKVQQFAEEIKNCPSLPPECDDAWYD